MKKYISSKAFTITMSVIAFTLLMTVMVFPELAEAALAFIGAGSAGTVGVMLGTTVSGPITVNATSAANSTHYERSVSDIVTFKKPAATPLDTLIRKVGKKQKARAFKAEWQEVAVRGTEDTITSGFTAAGNSTDESVDLDVTNTEIWNVGDTGTVPTVNGGDATPFVFYVTAVDTDADTITITGVNGSDSSGEGKRVPTIGTVNIYRLGPASTELNAQITEKFQVPVNDYNYCQTFQAQLSEGILESKHRAESGYNYNDKKMLALYDYRTQMEKSHLFGNRRYKSIGGEDFYFAGGAINKISNALTFGTGSGAMDIDADDIIDICENVFAPNEGSEERYLFAGKKLISAIDKIDIANRRIEAKETEIVVGMKVKTLISSHGLLHIVPNKNLDAVGDWYNKGIILDMDNVIKQELEEMTVTQLELNKSGSKKVAKAFRLDETACLQFRYAGANGVHATVGPAA